MASILSPGVVAIEKDQSVYSPAAGTTTFAVVGTASKGPVNTVTIITDEADLLNTFGTPTVDHLGLFASLRYLRTGRDLRFVRVASYDVSSTGALRNAADSADSVTMEAVSTGTWADGVQVRVTLGTATGSSKLTILFNSFIVEVFDSLLLGTANVADANYIDTRINGVSEYITVTDVAAESTLLVGTVSLSGGDDGAPVTAADVIGIAGSPPSIPTTGLQLFADPDTVDIDIVAIPGYTDATVVQSLIDFAEARGDVLALIDSTQGLNVSDVISWHNGTLGGANDPTSSLDSSFAALYWPWLTVFDKFSNTQITVPPSGHAAEVIARNDAVGEPWFAPAGTSRGTLRDVLSIEHSPTQGERDILYSGGNSINPIVNFAGVGHVVWGQRTLQRAPTALDRINVRRLMITLRKSIVPVAKQYIFEPNDPITWTSFANVVSQILETVRSGRGITQFTVITDASINTPAVVDRNEFKSRILVVPTKSAEFITLEFTILSQSGVSVTEA